MISELAKKYYITKNNDKRKNTISLIVFAR